MDLTSNDYRLIKPYHHFIFWSIYFLINLFRWGIYFDDYTYSLKTNLLGFPIHMALTYLNIYVLMPKLVFKKKYISYIILLLSVIYLMVVLKYNLTELLVGDPWREGPYIDRITLSFTINMMIGELYVITFVTAIKITLDFLKEHKIVNELEKANLQTELLFLRSQISPHFFFNTLNNIYSLAIDKSEKTPLIILKLSEVMRYLLYESNSQKQSLAKEIICIQNYIDLEKLRYDEKCEINLSVEGDVSGKSISPNILLTFVENSFKHSARNTNLEHITIDISFEIVQDFLYFKITNPKVENTNVFKGGPSKGIGLKNAKKRLELGYKKNEYLLNFSESKELYTVELKIKVS